MESAVRPKLQNQKKPKSYPGIGTRSIKEAKEIVLAYPNHSKVFKIYTDASSKQLGAVITQDNRPITFFSQKLSVAQFKYSVTKVKLLTIVKTLKEFKGILWGQSIKVFSDCKNLLRDALSLTSA
jgi:hypothetical protein